ncbi:MAG: hypothetical protein U5Q44_12650 [Dehalococcoidia bacterium]|nr:hypothetical protein [Dehalococcoidia bacterium]
MPGSHGIGFMDTRTGDIDLLRINPADNGVGHGYMASPGNRFVSAWGEDPLGGSGPRAGHLRPQDRRFLGRSLRPVPR